MMYSEFLELTQSNENQVDYKIYFEEIEPLYISSPSEINKDLFCKQWVMFFNKSMSDYIKQIDETILKNVNKKMLTRSIIVSTIELMKDLFKLIDKT